MEPVPKNICLRCGGPMKSLGHAHLQKGKHTYVFGDLDNLLSGAFEVEPMQCEQCGKMEFYSYEVLQRNNPAKPEPVEPKTTCEQCANHYDPELSQCPKCGMPNIQKYRG